MKPSAQKAVPVYTCDRKRIIARVPVMATSIGAARAAKAHSCYMARVDGVWAWVISGTLHK